MKSKYLILVLWFGTINTIDAQSKFSVFLQPSDSLNIPRNNGVIIAQSGLAGLSLLGLNQLWYNDFERSSFKVIDDGDEWLQMDKFGHVYSAYQLSRLSAESFTWSGMNKKQSLILGSAYGLGFLTAVEIMDGFSEEWGFSWYDTLANFSGTALYISQKLLWNEQRVVLKYSFSRSDFAPLNPDKLGDNFIQEMFKDYNGQTYWLSVNLSAFLKSSRVPKWLNLAVGFGGEGMLTAISGSDPDFVNQDRYRQIYLSLDVDLTRIHTNSSFLRTLFSVINTVKIPAPTLELKKGNSVIFRPIHF